MEELPFQNVNGNRKSHQDKLALPFSLPSLTKEDCSGEINHQKLHHTISSFTPHPVIIRLDIPGVAFRSGIHTMTTEIGSGYGELNSQKEGNYRKVL